MEPDEKTCPACAETVKAAANVCKHCGHNFTQAPRPAATPVAGQPKSGGIGKVLGLGCLFVVAAFLGLTMLGSLLPQSSALDAGKNGAPMANVSAEDLARAYSNNEVAAQKKYDGLILMVTGEVTGVELDFREKPVLRLKGVNMFMDVQAAFDESTDTLAAVRKGENVTVTCSSISEVASTPMLRGCTM